jgi:hypothetical protein
VPGSRDRRLGRHQHRAQVEVDRNVEIGHVDALNRSRAGMTDMVPHEVKPAEGVGGATHDRAGEIVPAEIADEAKRAASGGGDLRHYRIDARLVDVGNADRRAFAGKADRARPSHPRSRCRDNPDLPFQPHVSSP